MPDLSSAERDDINKQIAALQARLNDAPTSPKRKKPGPTELVPSTPSPRKKRKVEEKPTTSSASSSSSRGALQPLKSRSVNKSSKSSSNYIPSKPAPSKLLGRIADIGSRDADDEVPDERPQRTSAFTDRPHAPNLSSLQAGSGSKRDEHLAIIEDIPLGPVDHKPPFDDPNFEKLEPNSGIRLSSRNLPHDELQSHLEGRYYLSPSLLYSSIRLLPDKQGYDVPVPGDWITIAVVAERGPIKHSRAPIGINKDEDKSKTKDKGKQKDTESDESAPKGKRYVNMKLIDFGSRSSSSSSATGGKSVIRGDAFLSLLLFEADGYDEHIKDEGKKPKKVYRGGSRGAFEAMSKLKEGDVIALLNPRILKPFQRTTDKPHPTTNILAITPESADSITTIGRAKDLGMCCVTKRDGKPCGAWCDLRVNSVCDYHVEQAVKHARSSRAEFSVGTTALSTTAIHNKRKFGSSSKDYDPKRQWGLAPENNYEAGTTYVVSGHVVKGDNSLTSQEVMENYGRESQAKAQRMEKKREEEKALKALLQRDKEGMEAVIRARQEAERRKQREREKEKEKEKKAKAKTKTKDGAKRTRDEDEDDGDLKSKGKRKADMVDLDEDDDDIPSSSSVPKKKHKAYSADVIKHLGFDPTMVKSKPSNSGTSSTAAQKKLDALAALHSSRKKEVDLGPRPGPKVRSGVFAPTSTSTPVASSGKGKVRDVDLDEDERMVDLDSE
ncbi:hypothetical protein VKT23_014204 [Stygiomarasmius scandens]|uniref:Zinc finger Mcm10/DnaG-type domain-containing protein n=1 Tax=Marasmiellus scandens TaxID=2682957 RepID=A0ABR1J3K3_9AGAR